MLSQLLTADLEYLEEILKENPLLINRQDQDGKTLLHRAAMLGETFDEAKTLELLKLLFNASFVDLTIVDKRGFTALHSVASACRDERTIHTIFPFFVQQGDIRGYDFTMMADGRSFLHFALSSEELVKKFFETLSPKKTSHLQTTGAFNCLSRQGVTALANAIQEHRFESAFCLFFRFGADPFAGKPTAFDVAEIILRDDHYQSCLKPEEKETLEDLVSGFKTFQKEKEEPSEFPMDFRFPGMGPQ
jgi:hypothetical protein